MEKNIKLKEVSVKVLILGDKLGFTCLATLTGEGQWGQLRGLLKFLILIFNPKADEHISVNVDGL